MRNPGEGGIRARLTRSTLQCKVLHGTGQAVGNHGGTMRIKMILPALTVAYAGGWKKVEPFWDLVIRARHISRLRPMLEAVLTGFGRHAAGGGRRCDRWSSP